MKMTSAEANKLIKKYEEDIRQLCNIERRDLTFVASLNEDKEALRPNYDLGETDKMIGELSKKIRIIKHNLNIFNTQTYVDCAGMSIDQVLIYLPQLQKRKFILEDMIKIPEQSRRVNGNFIEYTFANFDIELARQQYQVIGNLIQKIQLELDRINTSTEIEFLGL